jgi:hypothetical protein
MWSLAPIVPIGALAITTIVYLTPGVDKLPALAAPLIGVALALIVFGLAVFLATRGAAEDRSVRTLGEIRLRLAVAEERLSSAPAELKKGETGRESAGRVTVLIAQLKRDLDSRTTVDRDPVGLWRLLHRIEEGLLQLAPKEEVVAEVVSDRQRLMGSSVPNADALRAAAEAALAILDPNWTETVISSPGGATRTAVPTTGTGTH